VKKILLIDGNYVLMANYYAQQVNKKNASNNIVNGASFGFMRDLLTLQKDYSKIIVCWDGPKGKEKRYSLYPEYKNNRLGKTEEEKNRKLDDRKLIAEQKDILNNILVNSPFPVIELKVMIY
jgi:5'-3' exonuclease